MSEFGIRSADMLDTMRSERPLVHNITNYVVMNFTANVLLSLGASPVMAHAIEEVEEMASLAGSLVLNIGTLSQPWIQSMIAAGHAATDRGIPVILDPVGAGATHLRTETALRIMHEIKPTVIRGNASEIMALRDQGGKTKGVDATQGVKEAESVAIDLAGAYGTVLAVTGPQDFVTDGRVAFRVQNGHALLGRVTGTGCAATAVIAALCAANTDYLEATAAGLVVFGVAAERAAQTDPGPGSFRPRLLDSLASLDRNQLVSMSRALREPVAP